MHGLIAAVSASANQLRRRGHKNEHGLCGPCLLLEIGRHFALGLTVVSNHAAILIPGTNGR